MATYNSFDSMVSRNIPKKIRHIILEKFSGRCAFPGCKWPAVVLHHVKRFAMVKRHLPEEIVPLCKIHHELAHAGLIKSENDSLDGWILDFKFDEKNGEDQVGATRRTIVDEKVQKCKKWAMKIRRLA